MSRAPLADRASAPPGRGAAAGCGEAPNAPLVDSAAPLVDSAAPLAGSATLPAISTAPLVDSAAALIDSADVPSGHRNTDARGKVSHAPSASPAEKGGLAAAGPAWSAGDSAKMYRIARWGPPYFSIDAGGRVSVRTAPGASGFIDLPAIIKEARCRRIESPLMIRFPEILRSQVERLHGAFADAIARTGYANRHLGLFPIKVNPLRHVVAEIQDAGRVYGMGLECGSRAELAAALPQLRDDRHLLVCNGVKDESMLALAMDAQRLGRQVIPVVQSPEEFLALRTIAARRGDDPTLGVRIGLSNGTPDRPDRYSVPDAKFGLSPADLLELLAQYPDALPRLGLLHFHVGSQVTDLARLRSAAAEAAQVYASLIQRGAGLRYLDVGGGLGVEYGDAPGSPAGLGYSLADYSRAIVAAVNEVCRSRSVPHPVLICESGRAVTAHHAVLIVPVLSVRERRGLTGDSEVLPRTGDATAWLIGRALHGPAPVDAGDASTLLSGAHDAYRNVGASFAEGRVEMEEFAVAERAFLTVARRIVELLGRAGLPVPAQFGPLLRSLADRVLCDFSVFQSLPDHWGSGQTYPVMPIDRLNERPTRHGILVDLTCDADGRIDRYVSSGPDASVLPMHAPRPGVRTELGFFLMGAYEDVLGAPHNLLGRVPEVHVRTGGCEARGFRIDNIVPATSVAGLLTQMGYREDELRMAMRDFVASKTTMDELSTEVGYGLIDRYAKCLGQGTYYEAECQGQGTGYEAGCLRRGIYETDGVAGPKS